MMRWLLLSLLGSLLISCGDQRIPVWISAEKEDEAGRSQDFRDQHELDLEQPIEVYQASFDGIEVLQPQGECTGDTWRDLEFIISPQRICIRGEEYAATRGVFRFFQFPKVSRGYLVDSGNLVDILSGISWSVSHGTDDANLSLDELLDHLKYRKVSLICGSVSRLGGHLILSKLGYETRLIHGVTLQERVGYDDSHTMFEVKAKDGWILVDLDMNLIFADSEGKLLNALEFYHLLNITDDSDFKFIFLANDPTTDQLGFRGRHTYFDLNYFSDLRFSSKQALKKWYKKVFQGLLIQAAAGNYFLEKNEELDRIMKEHYSPFHYEKLDLSGWKIKFYSE